MFLVHRRFFSSLSDNKVSLIKRIKNLRDHRVDLIILFGAPATISSGIFCSFMWLDTSKLYWAVPPLLIGGLSVRKVKEINTYYNTKIERVIDGNNDDETVVDKELIKEEWKK